MRSLTPGIMARYRGKLGVPVTTIVTIAKPPTRERVYVYLQLFIPFAEKVGKLQRVRLIAVGTTGASPYVCGQVYRCFLPEWMVLLWRSSAITVQ